MIRKTLAVLAMAVGALAFASVPAGATDRGHDPVVVCHGIPAADDQPLQGYIRIVVDDDSTKLKGHLEHSKDIIGPVGDEDFQCPIPEQPDAIVEVVTVDAGEPSCESDTVPTETTTTTTEYVWVDKVWVLSKEPSVEVTEGTRPLTEDERAALDCPTEQPEDKVVVVTIDTGEPVCDSDTVPTETTTTTTPYVWVKGDQDKGAWVEGEPTVVVTTGTRALTAEESEALAEECAEPTPVPTPNAEPTLPHTGPVDPMLPLGGLALLGAGTAAILGSRRLGQH